MDRPGLNKSFRMASVLKHGSRKRVRPEEDDFDMVLANETPKVVTMAKLEPILLEEIRKGLILKKVFLILVVTLSFRVANFYVRLTVVY